jgi:hypothetical protein
MRQRSEHLIKRPKATVNKVSRQRQNRKMQFWRQSSECWRVAKFFYDRYRGARAE